ncbi:carbon-phosphorus lyase complex subunit PhnI [Derxia lacustris]|uniref:carbon-phosphorus lyase complex subunit PhnI n=1 Tax=Derxia lacustris TaxID=764842 RepID=UPI000A176B41|nr:carbon-phosphorus lyase complex subunit PhnI [Derxia lacustris]
MYIAVKGGAAAIAAAERLLAEARRGDPALRAIEVAQIREQLGLLVDRVMAEAALHDPELAALALKQARGDAIEAVFLLRAFRTTLPRFGHAEPLDTARMRLRRRVSSVFKDLPGGQLLGASFDYTQRLLDFALAGAEAAEGELLATPLAPPPAGTPVAGPAATGACNDAQVDADTAPPALARLVAEQLIEPCLPSPGDPEPPDITRDPPAYPMNRAARLQMLARADEGWVLGLGYSSQRGYAFTHPFAGELRAGAVTVEFQPDELGFAIELGEVDVTECQMLTQFVGSAATPPQFTRGYGLVFGAGERKAMAMALADRVLRADEFGDELTSPAQQQEFALAHSDNVEASGFVQHLKLPHYVTFESELKLLRELRGAAQGAAA